MDDTERIALEFLRSAGYRKIVFEPDGNVPPDFLIDFDLAIECRRINQNVVSQGRYEGLEHAEASIFRRMKTFVESFGPPVNQQSWWISYTVHRPMPDWKRAKRELKKFFEHILSDRPNEQIEYQTSQGFSVDVFPAGISLPTVFTIGGYSDDDAGGFVVSELIRNIQICVDEKTRKVEAAGHKYKRWCLILVDRTNLGVDPENVADIEKNLTLPQIWEDVVLINPSAPNKGYSLKGPMSPGSP